MFNKKKIKELEDKIEVLEKWRDDILDKEWREENPDGIITCSLIKNYMGCDWEDVQTFRLFYGKNKFINFCELNKHIHIIAISSTNKGNGRFNLKIICDYRSDYHSNTCGYTETKYFLVDTKTEMVYNVDSEGRLI